MRHGAGRHGRQLRRSVCAAGQPAWPQVGGCVGLSASDREFPLLTGRSGTQRARACCSGEHLIRRSRHIVQDHPSWSAHWADIPDLSVRVSRCRGVCRPGSASAAAGWHLAGLSRERAGQNGEHPDQPAPPHPGVALDLLHRSGQPLGGPRLPSWPPRRRRGRATRRGQDDKTGIDVRAAGGELALPDRCRRALVAAVRAVEIGADAHLGGRAGTVRGDGHRDSRRRSGPTAAAQPGTAG